MVLESMLTGGEAMRHPFFMLLASVLICSVSLWAAFLSFQKSASILAVALITIALIPLFHRIFVSEEEKEAERPGFAASFIARHFNVVKVYAFFFIGLILAYAFWYSVVSPEVRVVMFSEQEAALSGIEDLRQTLTGKFSAGEMSCGPNPLCWFSVIFVNNALFVLVPMLFFSFVYGAGAVFLIGWNASVLGVLIGKDIVHYAATHGGLAALWIGARRMLGLLPHGSLEALGYFVGAIAGGIIGAAISKKRHLRGETWIITKDVIAMVLYAFGLLLAGAIIETYAIVSSL